VGIATAPLLHSGWDHLVANTGVYLVLGALVAIRGRRYLLVTALAAMVVGGGLTWLLGGIGNHIGASGVVFGFFGALVGAAFFERRLAAIGPALIVALFYNSMVVGFVPQAGVSWEGHAFGAVGGLWAAWVMRVRRSPPRELTDEEIGFDWRG
jgi:membrane associated rhomboid family serine protease